MSGYLTSITPDSFSGMIFALEGINRSVVLLNGPTGCKFYHSAVSDNQFIRQREFDPQNFPEKWFFGQPRVPCTYLDSGDYIYGSKDKLVEALAFLRDNVSFELLCVVNSPGASLIGDDLRGIAESVIADKPVVIIETPGYSSEICIGYETAAIELLRQLKVTRAPAGRPKTVNLLGLSLSQKYCAGDTAELERLLSLCGITVNCALCAGYDLESVRSITGAALNIVIRPEYGLQTAEYLREQYGMPYYDCKGPPVGFAATEKLVEDICALLGCDAVPFREDSKRARAKAYTYISRLNSLTGLPKAVPFAIEGTYSELYAYTDFLVRYFAMVPECLSVLSPRCDCRKGALYNLLEDLGLTEVLERDILDTKGEFVFGNGNTISKLKLKGHVFSGIETALPSIGYVDVIPKTHLGVRGALLLTEQIINGLLF